MSVKQSTRISSLVSIDRLKYFLVCRTRLPSICGLLVVLLWNFSSGCLSSQERANTISSLVLLKCWGQSLIFVYPWLFSYTIDSMAPLSMLNTGKQTSQFFDSYEVWNPHLNQNEKKYRLKSIEQYSREHNTNEQPGKQYFKATSLPEIINTAPMPTSKSSRQGHELEKGA